MVHRFTGCLIFYAAVATISASAAKHAATSMTRNHQKLETSSHQQQGLRTASASNSDWFLDSLFKIAPSKLDAQQVEFLHIPKNGGTAVEDAGHRSGEFAWGRYAPRWEVDKKAQLRNDTHKCSAWHIPPSLLDVNTANPYENKTVLCVKRHPYDRVISQYMWLKGKSCSVDGLNEWVQMNLQKYNGGNKWVSDCHFLPQTTYMFGDDGKQWCSVTFEQETLDDEFNSFMSEKGFQARLRPRRGGHWTYCPDLSPSVFTEENRQLIDTTYAKDFEMLGYSRTEW